MCDGIALAWSTVPKELIGRHGLDRRICERGGEVEIQFYFRDKEPLIPVWRDGQLQVIRWGNWRGFSRVLPKTGWTWMKKVEEGFWQHLEPVLVDIPAILGCERGIWYVVKQGMRGIAVPDEKGDSVCYMLCEPASDYYRVMTRSDRMPVLIQERY